MGMDYLRDPLRHIQQTVTEKAQEAARLRQAWQEKMRLSEAEARQKLEADVAAKKEEAKQAFVAGLSEAKTQADFEAQWKSEEATLRADFESRISVQKAESKRTYETMLETGIREAKRQAMMREKVQLAPRLIRTYRETQKGLFEEEMGIQEQEQKALFETGLVTAKELAQKKFGEEMIGWEAGEKESFEAQLQKWETTTRQQFEAVSIKPWKEEEAAKFETYMREWSKAWQPKGAAERILDVAASIGKPFELQVPLIQIPTPAGTLTVGLDVGKFFEGLAKGTVVAGAGVVAAGESLVYGVSDIAGYVGGFEVKHPRPPTTAIGASISSVIFSVQKGELAWSPEAEALAPSLRERGLGQFTFTYAASTILGDLLIAYGTKKLVIEPISETRPAQYIGYQFKAHAPKPLLQVVYGRKGAEAILGERAEAMVVESIKLEPALEVVSPKGAIEFWLQTEAPLGVEEPVKIPWIVLRGQPTTPMATTLRKAAEEGSRRLLSDTRGMSTILAPLETVKKVVYPELPTLAQSLQSGLTPMVETFPTALSLSAIIGIRAIAKEKAIVQPIPQSAVESVSVQALQSAQAVAQVSIQAQKAIQATVQVPVGIQTLRSQLKMKLPTRRDEGLPKRLRKKAEVSPLGVGIAEFLYPVLPEKKVPKFIGLSVKTRQRTKSLSVSSFIFQSRSRKNVKVRNKRK